jgi:cysteine-rich repeat protein
MCACTWDELPQRFLFHVTDIKVRDDNIAATNGIVPDGKDLARNGGALFEPHRLFVNCNRTELQVFAKSVEDRIFPFSSAKLSALSKFSSLLTDLRKGDLLNSTYTVVEPDLDILGIGRWEAEEVRLRNEHCTTCSIAICVGKCLDGQGGCRGESCRDDRTLSEYAAKDLDNFNAADLNGDQKLSPVEFLSLRNFTYFGGQIEQILAAESDLFFASDTQEVTPRYFFDGGAEEPQADSPNRKAQLDKIQTLTQKQKQLANIQSTMRNKNSPEFIFKSMDTGRDGLVDFAEYHEYMQVSFNCLGKCIVPACKADLQVNSPMFTNIIPGKPQVRGEVEARAEPFYQPVPCTSSQDALSAYGTLCGDGQLANTESCDDGNTVAGDGCSAGCTVEVGYTCNNYYGGTCSPSQCLWFSKKEETRDAFYEGHAGPDQYATGFLQFSVLPYRYATLVLTVAMVDTGGTKNGGKDTLYRDITLRIRAVNSVPYAITVRPFSLLEASLEIAQALPVFPIVSPGAHDISQSVSMTLTTPYDGIPGIFVDRKGSLLQRQLDLEQELRIISNVTEEALAAQRLIWSDQNSRPSCTTHECLLFNTSDSCFFWPQDTMSQRREKLYYQKEAIQNLQACLDYPCGPGTYKNTSTSFCDSCPADTFSPRAGATSRSTCQPCPQNSTAEAGSPSEEYCNCKHGFFRSWATGGAGKYSCKLCHSGSVAVTAVTLAADKLLLIGRTLKRTFLGLGIYTAEVQKYDPQKDSYVFFYTAADSPYALEWMTYDEVVSLYFVLDLQLPGGDTPTQDTSGMQNNNIMHTCSQCAAGAFPAEYGIAAVEICLACPAGKYSVQGSGNCYQCPPHSQSPPGSDNCRCNAGFAPAHRDPYPPCVAEYFKVNEDLFKSRGSLCPCPWQVNSPDMYDIICIVL